MYNTLAFSKHDIEKTFEIVTRLIKDKHEYKTIYCIESFQKYKTHIKLV